MATRTIQGAKTKKAHFQISSALFEELGERLVSKPEVALAELIKNSYDADGQECRLSIEPSRIVVADNGHGMTEDSFLNHWMVVSSQAKGVQRFSRTYGRSMAGSKGVGRFSARFLGNAVDLESIAWDARLGRKTRLTATFDWKKISKVKEIQTVVIDYTVGAVSPDTQTGTKLTIRNLRDDVSRISTAKVKTDVLRLTDPSSGLEKPPFRWRSREATRGEVTDPGFNVLFPNESPSPNDEFSGDVAASIIKSYVGRVRLEVTEDGKVSYQVYWRDFDKPIESKTFTLSRVIRAYTAERLQKEAKNGEVDERGLPIQLEDVQHLPLAEKLNSPVFIDLRFFPRRSGTFSELPVNGTKAQGWISSRAGFSIIDNNFAMANYASPESDWLSVDANKAANERRWQSIFSDEFHPMDDADRADPARNPMLALPRNKQIFGRVHIATRKLPQSQENESNDWLQPNMDRESLRDNGAFNLLWHIARFAVELLAVHDRNLRLEAIQQEEKARRKEAKTALSMAIAEVESAKDIEPAFRERIAVQLRSAEVNLKEAEAYSRDTRLSLELMSMMGVMAGFMTHEFEKAMIGLQRAAKNVKKFAHLSPALAESAKQIIETEKNLGDFLDYVRLFTQRARNPEPAHFPVKAQVDFALKTLESIANTHHVDFKVEIDSKLQGPMVPLAAYHGIVVNLVSNALKAMVGKVSTADRKVRIYATNDGNRHVLVVADTGIGIPDFLRSRIWDPLFTTTADPEDNPLGTGLGLGLSVVRRVVNELKGRVELMQEAPPGFVTAFRVSLPLERD